MTDNEFHFDQQDLSSVTVEDLIRLAEHAQTFAADIRADAEGGIFLTIRPIAQ